MWSRSWRCFNCGHRDDAVIQHHRQAHARLMAVSPQTVTVPKTVELPWEPESIEPLAALGAGRSEKGLRREEGTS
jgi:hypothetical protein